MNKLYLAAALLAITSVSQAMPPAAQSSSGTATPPGHPTMPGHPPTSGKYQPDGSPVGHPTVKEANKALGLGAAVDPATLPNEGKVLKTYPSNAYVYIQVERDGKERWLATNSFPVKEGDVVRYANGNMMKDFYSKKLEMTFPEVWFVAQVVKVKK